MNYSNEQIHIQNVSIRREDFLNKMEDSWDEKSGDYLLNFPEIDQLGDEIYSLIKQWKDKLQFEFIIEELTKLGAAPNLMYDDNGHFAISGDSFNNISDDIIDMYMTVFLQKNMWKNTIREALDYYLNDKDEEFDTRTMEDGVRDKKLNTKTKEDGIEEI